MRKWFKYSIEYKTLNISEMKKHLKYQDFEKSMGGYRENKFYENKTKFIKSFLVGRFKEYDNFLKDHLKKKQKIISIASGRCINELKYIDKGYNIDCSDLGIPKSYEISKKIFRKFKFLKLNILKQSLKTKYETAIALGLAYVFSEKELSRFFFNINKMMKINGNFILDSSSSPNNLYTYIFDNFFLKIEIYLISFFLNLFGKKNMVIKRHHGYKFTNLELIKIAESNGFRLVLSSNKDYLSDVLRSKIFNKIYSKFRNSKFFFLLFGLPMPYLRIFKFVKIGEAKK